jgi:exodeoxyribonuclease V beta subunit
MSLDRQAQALQKMSLRGVQWLQASAGTGKTHALVSLIMRLLEFGRGPGDDGLSLLNIATLTFTRAATSELRARIRAKLNEQLRESSNSEQDHHQRRVRLQSALIELEQAPILTLDAFLLRIWHEHSDLMGVAPPEDIVASDQQLIQISVERSLARMARGPLFRFHAESTGWLSSSARLARAVEQRIELGSITPDALFESDGRKLAQAALDVRSQFLLVRSSWPDICAHLVERRKLSQSELDAFEALISMPEQDAQLSLSNAQLEHSAQVLQRLVIERPELRALLDALRAVLARQRRFTAERLMHTLCFEAEQALAAARMLGGALSHAEVRRQINHALKHSDLAKALAKNYKVVLLDEAQDTEAQQFELLRAMQREGTSLIIVGDPKQSIYRFRGADLDAFFTARSEFKAELHRLDVNYRSRPLAIAAYSAVFASHPGTFRHQQLQFDAIKPHAEAPEAPFHWRGEALGGLQFWPISSEHSAQALAQHAVSTIQSAVRGELLDHAHAAPSYAQFAVLCETNAEVKLMAECAGRERLPHVALKRDPLYLSEAAKALRTLLQAILSPGQRRFQRTLLVSRFFRVPIMALKQQSLDEHHWQPWLMAIAQLSRSFANFGLYGLIDHVLEMTWSIWADTAHAARFHSDLRQLAEELLIDVDKVSGNPLELLEHRMARPERYQSEVRALERGDAVQIMTIHAAKGLEFDFVVLPFMGLLDQSRFDYPKVVPRGAGESSRFAFKSQEVPEQEFEEILAEQVRRCYVALTRARFATWLSVGAAAKSASERDCHGLHFALTGKQGANEAEIRAALDALCLEHPNALKIDSIIGRSPQPQAPQATEFEHMMLPRLRTEAPTPRLNARMSLSFSSLTRSDALEPFFERPASVEASNHPHLRGERFGIALHQCFETIEFAQWMQTPPAHEKRKVEQAMRRWRLLGGDSDLASIRYVCELIAQTLRARIAGTQLAQLKQFQREWSFSFGLTSFDPHRLERVLSQLRISSLLNRTTDLPALINGMLTGVIDLLFEHEGRFHLLDYKSNDLGSGADAYAPDALQRVIAQHHYDLQAMIYGVALLRWLKLCGFTATQLPAKLGAIHIVFVRGVKPDTKAELGPDTTEATQSPGIVSRRFVLAELEALDAVLSGSAP